MSFEMGVTLIIAALGVLNVLGTAGLWFKLGGLITGQTWVVDRLNRHEIRMDELEEEINVLATNFRVDNAHRGKGSS